MNKYANKSKSNVNKNITKKSPINNKKSNNAAPVYKKKPKAIITTQDALKKEKLTTRLPTEYEEPSTKYKETLKYLIKKGFFVAAKTGERVDFKDIKEFHIHTKNDVPVVVTETTKPNRKLGGISKYKRVFKIVRFNEEEIIGIISKNTNPWMMKCVDIKKVQNEINNNRPLVQ